METNNNAEKQPLILLRLAIGLIFFTLSLFSIGEGISGFILVAFGWVASGCMQQLSLPAIILGIIHLIFRGPM